MNRSLIEDCREMFESTDSASSRLSEVFKQTERCWGFGETEGGWVIKKSQQHNTDDRE